MLIPFNESLDKITNNELVYDILERLKFGNQHVDSNDNIVINKDEKLINVLLKLMNVNMPTNTFSESANLKIYDLHLQKNNNKASIIVTDTIEHKLIKAVSEETGIDYTNLISVVFDQDNRQCIVSFQSKEDFYNNETIKLYMV